MERDGGGERCFSCRFGAVFAVLRGVFLYGNAVSHTNFAHPLASPTPHFPHARSSHSTLDRMGVLLVEIPSSHAAAFWEVEDKPTHFITVDVSLWLVARVATFSKYKYFTIDLDRSEGDDLFLKS